MVHTKSPAYLPANILLLRGTKSWVNKRSTCFWQVASRRTWTLHSRRLIINDDAEQIVGRERRDRVFLVNLVRRGLFFLCPRDNLDSYHELGGNCDRVTMK